MKVYDISQEVLSCKVFPGDPAPKATVIMSMKDGDACNLSTFYMCSHNGTHIDAPAHFYIDGKTVDQIPIDAFVGFCFVARHEGILSANDAEQIMKKATNVDAADRILIAGKATVTEDAANVFAKSKIKLIGNESQTVGPEDAPARTHEILLEREIILLEGIRLDGIEEGKYLLSAAPLNLGGLEGSPCRAILIKM